MACNGLCEVSSIRGIIDSIWALKSGRALLLPLCSGGARTGFLDEVESIDGRRCFLTGGNINQTIEAEELEQDLGN